MNRLFFTLKMGAALALYWMGLISPADQGGGVWILMALVVSAWAGSKRAIDVGLPPLAGIFVCIPVLGWIYGLILLVAPDRAKGHAERDGRNDPKTVPVREPQDRDEKDNLLQSAKEPKSQPKKTTTMKLENYALTIPEAEEIDDGYAVMKHGTQYSIELSNESSRACDAKVWIDGGWVGTWRVDACDSIRLERPSGDTGRFTFFQKGSEEARDAELGEGDDLGLIRVKFFPEMRVPPLRAAPLSDHRLEAGGTGLTGESEQRFTKVAALDYDEEDACIIHLRLVARKPHVRPLHQRSTPVPPPVE